MGAREMVEEGERDGGERERDMGEERERDGGERAREMGPYGVRYD